MQNIKTNILIVGGGPSGMIAALCLAKYNIDSIIVEKYLDINPHPKAHELNTRSIEILKEIGISIKDLELEASPSSDGCRIAFCTDIQNEFGQIDLNKDINDPEKYKRHVESEQPYLNISQTEIEKILRSKITNNPFIQILTGHEWISCEQTDGVIYNKVQNLDKNKICEIHSKWLLAADGANSSIRNSLGIKMKGPGFIGSFVNAYFEKDLRKYIYKPAKLYWIVNPSAPGVFIAHHIDKRWVYNFPIYEPWEKIEDINEELLEQRIKDALGIEDLDIKIKSVSIWKMTQQTAESWRDKNIFLIGDAAHCFPPTGGLGMNSGIADAHNLCWKIAESQSLKNSDILLDSYEIERKPVTEKNGKESFENYEKFFEVFEALGLPKNGPEKIAKFKASLVMKIIPKSLRKIIFNKLNDFANKKINSSITNANLKIQQTIKEQIPHFDRIGLDLGYIYDDKATIKNNLTPKESTVTEYLPSFLPGARFPHMWLNFNQTISSHTLITYRKWTLICMNENDLNYFNIDLQPECLNMVLLSDLKIDFQFLNEFIKFADMDKLGLMLIRPDGHIALRALPNKDNKNILTNYFEGIGF